MRNIHRCPVCGSSEFNAFLQCQDHTVSHETFNLIKCRTCSLVITSPHPEPPALARYYQSDNYISHTTAPTSLFEKIYQRARTRNLNWKINIVKQRTSTPKGEARQLLDFGCGTGHFIRVATQNNFLATGVEPAEKARQYAIALTGSPVYEQIPPEGQPFDAITLWHVLEHVPDLNEIFSTIVRRLKKNGTMFIAVPNYQSKDAISYGPQWAGFDVPRHLWHFNSKSMHTFLRNHSLKLDEMIPMKLDAYYVSMLSEKYKAPEKNILAFIKGLARGWQSNLHALNTREYSSLIYICRK